MSARYLRSAAGSVCPVSCGGSPMPPTRVRGSEKRRSGFDCMSLTSMTGFARAVGASGAWRWTVELKCVNAKGLDLRLRLPPAFDRIEAQAKTRIGKALERGTCFATIVAQREGGGVT